MSNPQARLATLLACHGADISNWPEDARVIGLEALKVPELSQLIEQERNFERMLLERRTPVAPRDLTQRIIAAALDRRPQIEIPGWVPVIPQQARPMAFAAMLAIGFALGFGVLHLPLQSHANYVQNTTDDEGAIL